MARRIPGRWKSKFSRFVFDYGIVSLSEDLDVRPSAIYQWVSGATMPRPIHAENIRRLAGGQGISLTIDEIYRHSRQRRDAEAESLPFRKLADVVPISHQPAQIPASQNLSFEVPEHRKGKAAITICLKRTRPPQ